MFLKDPPFDVVTNQSVSPRLTMNYGLPSNNTPPPLLASFILDRRVIQFLHVIVVSRSPCVQGYSYYHSGNVVKTRKNSTRYTRYTIYYTTEHLPHDDD